MTGQNWQQSFNLFTVLTHSSCTLKIVIWGRKMGDVIYGRPIHYIVVLGVYSTNSKESHKWSGTKLIQREYKRKFKMCCHKVWFWKDLIFCSQLRVSTMFQRLRYVCTNICQVWSFKYSQSFLVGPKNTTICCIFGWPLKMSKTSKMSLTSGTGEGSETCIPL